MNTTKKRILTGDRPTGPLHLGHYVGSLANRVKLQDEYDTFLLIADVQALTTNFEHPERLREDVLNVALDYLAVGIDPDKVSIVVQSLVPPIAELAIYFSMLVSVNALRHNPTIKTEAKEYGYKEMTYGFLGYPVHQAADIAFVKAHLVPVGIDQVPHIEHCRKIVRKFNGMYGDVLIEPAALVSDFPRLVGLDGGKKMSKSLGNCIYLSDDSATVKKKVMSMYTDPTRIHATDPGHVKGNPVFQYHDALNANKDEVTDLKKRYRKGTVGDVEVKQKLFAALEAFLEPIRARRKHYEERISEVKDILLAGTDRANRVGHETIEHVRAAMHMTYFTEKG
jgi:tryptophanyl-tRNA synthetase